MHVGCVAHKAYRRRLSGTRARALTVAHTRFDTAGTVAWRVRWADRLVVRACVRACVYVCVTVPTGDAEEQQYCEAEPHCSREAQLGLAADPCDLLLVRGEGSLLEAPRSLNGWE